MEVEIYFDNRHRLLTSTRKVTQSRIKKLIFLPLFVVGDASAYLLTYVFQSLKSYLSKSSDIQCVTPSFKTKDTKIKITEVSYCQILQCPDANSSRST